MRKGKRKLKKFLEIIKNKWLIKGTTTLLLVLIVIACYIGLNILVEKVNVENLDFTEKKLYSLSEETKTKLKDLDQDVTIQLINAGDYSYVIDYAKKYTILNSKIQVEEISDLSSRIDLKTKYNLSDTDMLIVIKEGEKEKTLTTSDLSTYDYSTYKQIDLTEEAITNAIVELSIDKKPVIYVLSSKSYYQTEQVLSNVIEKLQDESNEIKYLDILASGSVPEDCNCLVITTLKEDLNELERDKILEYIKNGGKIMMLTSQNVVNVDTGEVVLNGVTSTSNTGEIKKGDFLFKNVRIGNYKVEISTNDYEIVSKYISVFKNKTSDCGIIKLNRVKYDDYDIVKLNGHYDVVKMISEGKYLVVKDGLCGVIDANENLIIPIIYNADNSKEVAVDEILLVKDNVGYVYNSNTLNLICRYLIEETIEDSSAYKYEKITESSEYVNYPDNIIKREYWQGMIIETVECGWSMSSNGSSGVWNSVYVKFINARTGKNIVQGFGKSYIPISGDNWNGIATSSKTNDHSAVAVIEDIENDKLFMYIITKDGCNGREISSNEVVGENVAYDNHWIKMRGYIPEQGYAWKLMNVDTGHTYSMPYNEFSSWYYGNDKYYALSLEGSLYNICYENRIISTQKYKFVNFTNDKILIAGDLNGECIFMDYSLNEKLRAKDASVYWNGKALVYDGIGVYYIDEFCKKTSSYLYKNTSIDYMSIGAFKAEGQWYIIK